MQRIHARRMKRIFIFELEKRGSSKNCHRVFGGFSRQTPLILLALGEFSSRISIKQYPNERKSERDRQWKCMEATLHLRPAY